ncbi:DUF2268 domain-containing putative Zn-dependent protease [Flavobacterium sp.]|uniref:DUF2268 domain-containing protein n=1 Tax=Flavobacterium sp. TaxID=239 RepID=UPI00286E1D66|nr:DUF2268 domain-containing putative Zn-dependent protease [Flavobacterium sp.]
MKNIKITITILLLNLTTVFGQSSDKIIFLTNIYKTFVTEVKTNEQKTDSIYKKSVQNLIFEKYFQKSEYADIVKEHFASPIKNSAELSKSIDQIIVNENLIKSKIMGSLKKSRKLLENKDLTIYIIPVNPENKQIITAMSGIMGLTAGSKQIILTIEPDIKGWDDILEYAVAHEYNHTCWTKLNFGKSAKWTLLDYLVFEGRGDYFAHLLYPNVKTPWTASLTENQKKELWTKIKPNLQNEDMQFQFEVMFGSRNYPIWGGYSLGFDIVSRALSNKKLKAIDWINMDSSAILELSRYK